MKKSFLEKEISQYLNLSDCKVNVPILDNAFKTKQKYKIIPNKQVRITFRSTSGETFYVEGEINE